MKEIVVYGLEAGSLFKVPSEAGWEYFWCKTVQEREAKQFFAYVQLHTVSFFKRRRWKPVGEPVDYHGQPHQLMEAQL